MTILATLYDLIALASVALGVDLGAGDHYRAALERLAAREGLYSARLKDSGHYSPCGAAWLHEARVEAADWPALGELARFRVTRYDTERGYKAAGAARDYLVGARGVVPLLPWELDAWHADLDARYRAWYVLDDAVLYSECGRVFEARQALHELRGLIGDEAFARGEMPAPVPPGKGFPPYLDRVAPMQQHPEN